MPLSFVIRRRVRPDYEGHSMSDLLRDARTVQLLDLLWKAPSREAGIPIIELPERLQDEGLFTEWIGTDLIEVVRPKHHHQGGGVHRKLVVESGWDNYEWEKPGRKRPWQMLQEAMNEPVAPEIRHRVRLGKAGEREAARINRIKKGEHEYALVVNRKPGNSPSDLPLAIVPLVAARPVVQWKLFPFKNYSGVVGSYSVHALQHLARPMLIPSRPPASEEISLILRIVPNFDQGNPNWEMVKGALLAHGVHGLDETVSLDALLGILLTIDRRASSKDHEPTKNSPNARATRDKSLEARDRWIYQECCRRVAYDTIAIRLKSKPSSWPRIESKQGIQNAAKRYAERNNLPPIPKRQEYARLLLWT